jgi:hypothetical protein
MPVHVTDTYPRPNARVWADIIVTCSVRQIPTLRLDPNTINAA